MDIAGGHGSLLAAILRGNPHLQGILFDLPQVIEGARHEAALNDPAVASRRSFVGGSFFEEIPATADVYMMKWILHNWNDDESIAILRNIRRAMRPGGKLLVIEMVIRPDNAPSPGKLLDLAMLIQTGGMERTEAQYRRLFNAADLEIARVIPTASAYSIMETIPR
jgi:ubiquinone/menaquinone biosynthesis C-methylase UbiE